MPSMHIVIKGKVQGVGFRWFARMTARQLDLKGWVRNLENGTVEIAAAGPQQALNKFADRMRSGPEGARVDELIALGSVEEKDLDNPFAMHR